MYYIIYYYYYYKIIVKNMSVKNRVTIEDSLYMRMLYQENGVPVKELCQRFPTYSRATIFRHVKRPLERPFDRRKLNEGRPRKLTLRDERNIVRHVNRLRKVIGPFTVRKIAREAGISKNISVSTVTRVLKRHGYKFLHSRRKGIMKPKDLQNRLKFARTHRNKPLDFWKKNINFYLDGKSFTHKTNPHDEARSTRTMAWRKRSEGLDENCTAKGKKAGTGGRMAHFMVAISHGHGVVLCHQYQERMSGEKFANIITENFPSIFEKTQQGESKLFLQDGCPVQNSAAARRAMEQVDARIFSIPPRSPDLNPIENFFHLVSQQLHEDALKKCITHETYNAYIDRIYKTFKNFPIAEIDKLIASMPTRFKEVIRRRGQRLRF